MKEFFAVYAVINIVVFLVYGVDKYKAIHKRYRISERTLLLLAVFGVIGAIFGMILFWHKIRKTKFVLVTALIFVSECGFAVWLGRIFEYI